jgi:protein-arginine kinase activator protein McsA
MLHVGERYAAPGIPVPAGRAADATELRRQLRDAIDAENFELAADLRDRLRQQEGAS